MTLRLNLQHLKNLPANVILPHYERSKIKPGIFHLGIGAFHRAHQAFYTDAVMNQAGDHWGIIGCSLRSASVRDQLVPQDGLFTLVERSGAGNKMQIIGSVLDVMLAPENPAAVIAAMVDQDIRIISLTITEKGYCHDPATGQLNLHNSDIIHDLANPTSPITAIGFLVAALAKRHQQQHPVTILSCDNLPDNGALLKRCVIHYAKQQSDDLARWIDHEISFPNNMVDRIVPATTEDDRQEFETLLGMRDEGLVICEPFSQWVIEDHFVCGRPTWENAGALLVKDVKAYEKIKLRLLNGAHSLMAYSGYLSGYQYINEVMENPAFVNLVRTYMQEDAGKTITAPPGFDIENYKHQLLQRFSNPALKHRTWQIAMDGSQKLPQRLLSSLREQLVAHGPIDIICLAIAAWMRYVSGVDDQGDPIDVVDPLAAALKEITVPSASNMNDYVNRLIRVEAIFGKDLPEEKVVVATVVDWMEQFSRDGVKETIERRYG